ncbi:MAG: GTP cyclohydrolase I FolE2 [Spirochaetaceae bacterium]|nr:GTP cyclohydrolase I FolE2 [Spirochaetaceae bacterium]MBO4704399.1 GTP cyclohydrolase I FolE2 [Spirochaetaceae bacterium]
MRDIQNEFDSRKTPLQKVGVKGVRYPVTVLDKNERFQQTTAVADLYVNLPHNFKGTHMSRFIETFHKYHEDLTMNRFMEMLSEIREKLSAEKAFGCITFPYFIEKKAPVSGSSGIMEYNCSYEAEVSCTECDTADEAHGTSNSTNSADVAHENRKFYISIEVPVTTLCPCSKAISEHGAHNQRGTVKVKLLYSEFFWIEDIISMIESCASSPLYSVLKRRDEKYVTEHAYENPRFVEDVVREVYIGLKKQNFKWFSVECTNFESIHYHNAYAYAEYDGADNKMN